MNVNKIESIRKAKKLTQVQLAEISGVSTSGIFYIESGQKEPKLSTARKLASALNTTVDELFPEPNKHTA